MLFTKSLDAAIWVRKSSDRAAASNVRPINSAEDLIPSVSIEVPEPS